jgi:hypothetical protein
VTNAYTTSGVLHVTFLESRYAVAIN